LAFENIMRSLILNVAGNRVVSGFATRYGLRLGAGRFVAGPELQDAIRAVRELNAEGLVATVDNLGESVDDPSLAREAADRYVNVLEAIKDSGVDSGISIKLTQMGLDIDQELCLENMRMILDRARDLGIFVRIDMEGSEHTERTVQVFEELAEVYGQGVGLVLQVYLYRTEDDIERLKKFHPNLRLCKGAYLEPPEIAFPTRLEVDRNFCKVIAQHLENGDYAAVATHDEDIIEFTKDFAAARDIPRDQFEFQMLYGIRHQLQKQLADEGYTVRTYVPFGTDWYPYFTRRLAERPANLFFVLRNLIRP